MKALDLSQMGDGEVELSAEEIVYIKEKTIIDLFHILLEREPSQETINLAKNIPDEIICDIYKDNPIKYDEVFLKNKWADN